MRIEQLEYLVEIGKSHSISVAAEKLYVSQPSVSEAIKKLEMELGVELLIREKTGSHLTPIGEQVVQEADVILKKAADIKALVQQYKEEQATTLCGDLIIYSTPGVNAQALPRAMDAFCEKHPGVIFSVGSYNANRTLEALQAGECDLGIITTIDDIEALRAYVDTMEVDLLSVDRLYLQVSKESELATRKSISLKEAAKLPLAVLSYDGDTFWNDVLFSNLEPENVVLRTDNSSLLHNQIKANRVCSFTLGSLIAVLDTEYAFIPIRTTMKLYVYGVYKKGYFQSDVIRAFLDMLRDIL